jgi:hypothetical protein
MSEDLDRNGLSLLVRHRVLAHFLQLRNRIGVVSEILFAAHENERHVRAEVLDFRHPLHGERANLSTAREERPRSIKAQA